jgi:hypothetical protein
MEMDLLVREPENAFSSLSWTFLFREEGFTPTSHHPYLKRLKGL